MQTREEDVRLRAYELWEEAGRTGSSERHWLQAERELQTSQPYAGSSISAAPNEGPVDRYEIPATAPEEHNLIEQSEALCKTAGDTVRNPVTRLRASLLELVGNTPRSWPWRLSPSRYC